MVWKHRMRMKSCCGQLLVSCGSIYVKCFNSVESEPKKLVMKNVKLLWKGSNSNLILNLS